MATSYSLTPSVTSITEGGQVTFTVTRTGDRPAETIYFSALSDGTATYGEGDFTTTSGGQPLNIALSFGSGVSSRSVTLNIVSDGSADSGESFRAIVQRNSADPASTFLARSSFVTINDAPQSTSYSVTPSVSTATEGGQVSFTITRSGDKPSETVYFSALSDGTATYGEGDFTTTSGGQPLNLAVSFGSGVTSQTVTLNVASDGVADSGEQFRTIVQRNSTDPASTFLARSNFVTINDAPQNTSYSLTPSVSSVTEGGQVTFTITRSGDRPSETVYFSALGDDTATYSEGDFTTTSGGQPLNIAVSFGAGVPSQTVTLNIVNDGVADSGEEFRAIVQRNSGDSASTFLARSSFVAINDAPQNTSYSLAASAGSVTEGGQVTFTITRSGDKPSETVYFSALGDGTATYSEGDFTTTSGGQPLNIAVSFGAGITSQTVTLNIANDGVADSGEQFRAIVQRNSADEASTFLARSGFVTINDAPQNTTYSLTPSTSAIAEGGKVTFTITRSGDKPVETVYFSALGDATATYGEGDFTTTSGGQPLDIAVNFGAGVTSQTVTLNIASDGVADSGEEFRAIVQRNSADPASVFLARSSFVTINDATANTAYSLTPSTSVVTEGGQITFTITRTGDKPAETVYFSPLSDGTATYAEGDFTTTSGGQPLDMAVNFAAGVASQSVTLNVVSDGTADSAEQFRAIVQRNTADVASTYLARSSFVSINDPGQSTTYSLTPLQVTVTEGEQLTFVVRRVGDKPAETIYFSTLSDGTATYGEGDFTTTSGGRPLNIPVTFGAGVETQTVVLNIVSDSSNDGSERFRAILQRNSTDGPSTYLHRSEFVSIEEADAPAPQPGIVMQLLSYVVNVAHAEENATSRLNGFRYPVSESGMVTEARGDSDGWNIDQDLGSRYAPSSLKHPDHRYFHLGEDWNANGGADAGQPARAVYNGFVRWAQEDHDDFGKVVVVEHTLPNGQVVFSLYAHLDDIDPDIIPNAEVKPGQLIGYIGMSGAAPTPHLHFEMFSIGPGATIADYLANDAYLANKLSGHFGYTHDPTGVFGEGGGETTAFYSFTQGDFTWYNPSMFIDRHRDEVVIDTNDSPVTVDIASRGLDAVVSILEGAKEIVLGWFEQIRLLGGAAKDILKVNSLFGTTIDQNTIYFDGGAEDDVLDGSAADRRLVAEGGLDDDTLTGGSENDLLKGDAGEDVLAGGDGSDELQGGDGDDRLNGGSGSDVLRGGADDDVAIFNGERSSYQLSVVDDLVRVVGPDGSDTLVDVEQLSFADGNMLVATPVETSGGTRLLEVINQFFMRDENGVGPSLKDGGLAVTDGRYGAWNPLGAEQAGGGYRVAWQMGTTDQFLVWTTDQNGNRIDYGSMMSANDYTLQSLETTFQQDLNGDSQTGLVTTMLETSGSTRLAEVANRFYLRDGGGAGPALKDGGIEVVEGRYGAWTPIGAEQSGGGYRVAWKMGADQYVVWTADANGNRIDYGPQMSGRNYALQSLETTFQQDLNGDGTTGLVTTVIETAGATRLAEVGDRFYLRDGGGAGPALKDNGIEVVEGQYGGWSPIGVEQSGGGYRIAWKLTGADQYFVWTTDSNGNRLDYGPMMAAGSYALQGLETTFLQDLNGDGQTGLFTTAIETAGSTRLVQVGPQFYLRDGGGTGPSLKDGGVDVADGQYGAWKPIGAEQSDGAYRIAWKMAGADQYIVWTADSNGNRIDYGTVVSAGNYALQSLETTFQQDLNGDGQTGLFTTAIEASGSTQLVQVGPQFYLRDGGGTGPSLKDGGVDVTDGQFGAWKPIGVEQSGGGYLVAWKVTGADQYIVWTTDSTGNRISYGTPTPGANPGLESLETTFQQDLNGDGHTGLVSSTIETAGGTRLVQAGNQFFLRDGAGAGPSLKDGGVEVTDGQFGAWKPLGVEQSGGGYLVAWKVTGADQYVVWTTDADGNRLDYGSVMSGNAPALQSFETAFQQDLNADGHTGLASIEMSEEAMPVLLIDWPILLHDFY